MPFEIVTLRDGDGNFIDEFLIPIGDQAEKQRHLDRLARAGILVECRPERGWVCNSWADVCPD